MKTNVCSKLKRSLAWVLAASLMLQGSTAVSAADFTSGPADMETVSDSAETEFPEEELQTGEIPATEPEEGAAEEEPIEEEPALEEPAADAEPDETEPEADVEFADDAEADVEFTEDPEENDTEMPEEEPEAAANTLSDDVELFSDGAGETDGEGETKLKRETGECVINGDEKYSWTRLLNEKNQYVYAIGSYPANNANVTLHAGDSKGIDVHVLNISKPKAGELAKLPWNNVSNNTSYTQIDWSSSDENIARIPDKSGLAKSTMTVEGVNPGTATITGTWRDQQKSNLGEVKFTFNVTVTEAIKEGVDIGEKFTVQGLPTTPKLIEVGRWDEDEAWGSSSYGAANAALDDVKASGAAYESCEASFRYLPSEGGKIGHAFMIDYREMVGQDLSTISQYTNNTHQSGFIKETLCRKINAPADNVYIQTKSPVVWLDQSVVNVVASVFIDGQRVGEKDAVQWSSSDDTVIQLKETSFSDTSALYTASLKKVGKPGVATVTAKYKDYQASIDVYVRGFAITEPEKTIQMSLDDEVKTRKIQYCAVDENGLNENPDIEWTIDNKTVAVLDSEGNITPKSAGEATVSAKWIGPGHKDTVKVVVTGAGSLNVDKDTLNIQKGASGTIKATATYNNETQKDAEIIWKSSDEKVATVENGTVTGVEYGDAVISAEWTAPNGKLYTNDVKVGVRRHGLFISQPEVSLTAGGSVYIIYRALELGELASGAIGGGSVEDEGTSGYTHTEKVTWTTSNEKVATVEWGRITAGSETGEATLTAKWTDASGKTFTGTVKVTVTENPVITIDTPLEVKGTAGAEGSTHRWRAGYYNNGTWKSYDSKVSVSGTTASATVTGKIPNNGLVPLTHNYQVKAEGADELYNTREVIRVKLSGKSGLYFDETTMELKVGGATGLIVPTVLYEDGSTGNDYIITYESSDPSVATVAKESETSKSGIVTPVSPGKTTITGTVGGGMATCEVTVTGDKQLILTPKTVSMKQGDTTEIKARAWDGSAYVENPEITWTTSKKSVATVENGVITAVNGGEAVITAEWGDLREIVEVKVSATKTVTVVQKWDDADNQDGIRPDHVKVQLTANGEAKGDAVTLNEENGWTSKWEKLDYADAEEKAIEYGISAVEVPENYEATVTEGADDVFTVTYTHKPGTVNVSVGVTWDDVNNQDGIRPSSVSVQLKADGENQGDRITLDEASGWTKTWTGLPKNKAGKAIEYTVEVTGIPETYATEMTGSAAEGFQIVGSYVPKNVSVPVSLQWSDANNQDGIRPGSVTVELLKNGAATGTKAVLNAANGWKTAFSGLASKENGKAVTYSVKGQAVGSYTAQVSGNALDGKGLVLTYAHTPARVNVTLRTSWNDAGNQDGKRPSAITIRLKKNGAYYGDAIRISATGSKTWSNLPKFQAGKAISYTVQVFGVSGYSVKVTGNMTQGFVATYTHAVEKLKITVRNTWSDLDNAAYKRPSRLTVSLYADGRYTGKRAYLTSGNKWTVSFSGFNRYKSGRKINYTVKASTPSGYKISTSSDGNGNIKLVSKYTKVTRKFKLKTSKSVTYTGRVIRPKVSVYAGSKKLSSKYYKVSYKNAKNPGRAVIVVQGRSKYSKYAAYTTFDIKPKQVSSPKVKAGKAKLGVYWKRVPKASGYVVQYSTNSKFRSGKVNKWVSSSASKVSLTGLKRRKTYYVHIRAYKTVNGKRIYSSWTKTMKMKTK